MTQKKYRYCVTGGAGYLGYHICKALKADGNHVIIFDKHKPPDSWKDADDDCPLTGFTYVQGDVRNIHDLEGAFAQVDCVIHAASFGMSSREQLPLFWNDVEEINVGGTKNVIEACCHQNVTSLVYSSTNNVVFDGREIRDGDESLPYTPSFKHADHYSRTKSTAEQMILLVDGKAHANSGGVLRTCALRLGGIVGPKEQRHALRILNYIRSGALVARFWHNDGLGDLVLIHNAVSAHVLAAKALLDTATQNTVGGQPYFISDGKPTNTFEYFLNIGEELGYSTARLRIPVFIVLIFVSVLEMMPAFIHYKLSIWLSKSEVQKATTTHYFSIAKAKKELGYNPTRPNDIREIVDWLRSTGFDRRNATSGVSRASQYYTLLTLLLVAILAITVISM